jgi:hypothetical protein
MPTTFLEKAITKVTIGKSSKSTMVFAGTPAETAPLIAYLTGLNGQTGPIFWFSKRVSKGPSDSVLFWVISTGETAGVDTGEAETDAAADSVAAGSGATAFACAEFGQRVAKPKTTPNNIENIFRMGINYLKVRILYHK